MSDDAEENVVHFAPRISSDDKDDFVPNPLNLRRELQRNALTKGLVAFDEFGQQIILQRPIPRPNLKGTNEFEPVGTVVDQLWAEAVSAYRSGKRGGFPAGLSGSQRENSKGGLSLIHGTIRSRNSWTTGAPTVADAMSIAEARSPSPSPRRRTQCDLTSHDHEQCDRRI